MPPLFVTKFVTTDDELVQIAALSDANLVSNVSDDTKGKEGFVTWAYTPEILRSLHAVTPSVIVKHNNQVAGYALVLPQEAAQLYPPLAGVLQYFKEHVTYQGKPVSDYRFYVMGQVCVHPQFRGQGVFDKLYQFHREQLAGQYDFILTEISTRNLRSQRAHERVGFTTIHTYHDNMDEWNVVLWNFM
ncbi:GNAT family N-acetyltransferase [Deminuibacter soli]|uniref:GNAT family N-acetyltransferase n=1 Tax=Deminuibacter soli TaxID=2291815 RepID=A0A3E1NJ87_9BACT|nr:GNAT family N-acetyltransferase [Deminuibacter soli]RFM28000.1 GNAT family N-acetyltransferase [Deminuibacter soli]